MGASIRYGELAAVLRAEGLALGNLASLPHISVAGAVATATHGSGDANGNLATAVAGLELVTSGGELVTASRGDPDFDGLVVGLGALGAVTRITLDVEPAYEVRQRVFEGLGWDSLFAHLDELTASGYSVSILTRWGDAIDQVWVKTRVTDGARAAAPRPLGRRRRDGRPAPDPGPRSRQLHAAAGTPGPWSERLPHFRLGHTPSNGDEIQSEYLAAAPRTPWRGSRPCAPSRARSGRCCRCPRSARSPPTASG